MQLSAASCPDPLRDLLEEQPGVLPDRVAYVTGERTRGCCNQDSALTTALMAFLSGLCYQTALCGSRILKNPKLRLGC